MCFRNTWFGETFCELPMDIYKRVISELPPTVESVVFGGMGEPLFHKDIVEMVRLAAGRVPAVELLTNGTLLDKAMSRGLIDAGLAMLWVSMDSFEPIEEHSHGGHANFSSVQKNLAAFNELRSADAPIPKLGIAFVVSKSNAAQLKKLGSFVEAYRVQEVNVSNLYPSDAQAEKEVVFSRSLNQGIGSDIMQKQDTLVKLPLMDWNNDDAAAGMRDLLMSIFCTVQLGAYPVTRRSRYCRFVSEGMAFIRSDGDVSPCMALLHNGTTCLEGTERTIRHHSFGNVKEKSLGEIWQSGEYAAFRERVRNFTFSPCVYCAHCEYAESNQEDCTGNSAPTCGACLWAEGFLSCP
jgi:MoaA/NifB/PqqE/SkfB family radical SAM enzyme